MEKNIKQEIINSLTSYVEEKITSQDLILYIENIQQNEIIEEKLLQEIIKEILTSLPNLKKKEIKQRILMLKTI